MPAAKVEKFKLAFFSIPKSASTSIKCTLFRLREGVDWSGIPDRVHPQFPTYFPITPKDFLDLEDYYKFTVVRDPIERFLSSYNNRVHFHKDIANHLTKIYRSEANFRQLFPDLCFFPDINNYILNLDSYQKLCHSIMHHTIPSFYFIGADLYFFDKVYPINRLKELEHDITKLTGQHTIFKRFQENDRKYKFEDLSIASKRKLLEYTKAEYDFLRNFFNSPAL